MRVEGEKSDRVGVTRLNQARSRCQGDKRGRLSGEAAATRNQTKAASQTGIRVPAALRSTYCCRTWGNTSRNRLSMASVERRSDAS